MGGHSWWAMLMSLKAVGMYGTGGCGIGLWCFSRGASDTSDTCCTWGQRTMQRLLPVAAEVVLSHTHIRRRSGCWSGLLLVVTDEQQAEFIYEHVEGAEEPPQPEVVASRLVQARNLIILVHSSHVLATRCKVRVPGGRTLMQNSVTKAWSSLTCTWCSQPQAVVRLTV